MRGRSSFARLALANYDVGALMGTDPIVEWSRSAWDGLVSNGMLASTWKQAMIQVGTAKRPLAEVRGPAGAIVASAIRIGWRVPLRVYFLRQNGDLLKLYEVAPVMVAQLAAPDLAGLEAATTSLAKKIGGPPDLEPLKGFLRSAGRTTAASLLRALGEGGRRTGCLSEGLPGVTENRCRACGVSLAPCITEAASALPRAG